ncbi:MAG: universal stress protein [Desulfobulbaceae bacterium]|nr:universal stress protein [Desulfobulbaceae bacterium]
MLKPIRSIMFATDLTANCQQALEFTIVTATRFKATIYMLHVIEKLPEHVNERLKDLLGNHDWNKMIDSHKMTAHKSLLGKTSTNALVREAIHDFCKMEGIDDDSGDLQSREIIISDGDIVEDILENAKANNCDMIVLGGHRNLFSKRAVGSTARGVLKSSKIPVTVVPPVTSD